MGELKPIGSEKLKGDEKIQRILDLTYYQSKGDLKESSEVVKESKSGVYGVVKEKDGYYVKKGLNENSLDYIGGMFMKNKNKFSTYNEALKKMEFLTEQENVQEATKYVLKQPKTAPAPAEEPVAPPAVDPSMDAPMPGDESLPTPDEGGEDPNDFMSVIKKDAGSLQQKLNQYKEQLESPDYAEIVNQVLSAIDFEAMEDTDKESILDQLGAEEDVQGSPEVPGGELPLPSDTDQAVEEELPVVNDGGMGEMNPHDEVDEIDGMSLDGVASLDELINTPLDDEEEDALAGFGDEFLDDPEIAKAGKVASSDMKDEVFGDISKYPKYGEEEVEEQLPISGPSEEDEIRDLDLDELTNMVSNSVNQSLGKYFE